MWPSHSPLGIRQSSLNTVGWLVETHSWGNEYNYTHTHTRPSTTESNMHSTSLLPYLFTTTSLHLSIYIPPFPSLHIRIDCRLSPNNLDHYTSTYSPAHRGPQSHRPREEASQTPPALEPLQARERRERRREREEREGVERERRERGGERGETIATSLG